MALPDALTIEQAGLQCWPAIELDFDGSWVRRAAGGYTRRANSVQSFDLTDDANAPERIAAAVRWFEQRRVPPVFRITPHAGPRIHAALDAAGWVTTGHSKLLAMELGSISADPRAEFYDPLDERFLVAQRALQGYDDDKVTKLRTVLRALEVPARGIVLHNEAGAAVSSSLMSVNRQIVITGNVVTDARIRRRGYGGAMMRSGLAWARSAGARFAALNVAAENAAGQALYRSLGYAEQYGYHYRIPGPA